MRIRPLTRDVVRRLRRQAMDACRREGRTDAQHYNDTLDRLIYRWAVEDWRGFVDPRGAAIPVSDANVERHHDHFGSLAEWTAKEGRPADRGRGPETGRVLKKLAAFARYRRRRPRGIESCAACRVIKAPAPQKAPPSCERCGLSNPVALDNENREVWEVFQRFPSIIGVCPVRRVHVVGYRAAGLVADEAAVNRPPLFLRGP